MGKKLKNKDIAARLGLSGTLVSLVLNNKADQHGIKKETQERVFAVARQMGYFTSAGDKPEKNASEEKPGVIGMVVPSMDDPFIYDVTPYLQKAFASIGLGFSLFTRDPDDLRFNRLMISLKKFFTGMILMGDAADENLVRTLNREDYPVVLLEKSHKRQRMNTVCSDMTAGSDVMIEHLASLGYKNLLIVSDEDKNQRDRQLVDDLKTAVKKSKSLPEVRSVGLNFSKTAEKFDISSMEHFLKPPFRTDAIIVTGGGMVVPLLTSLRAKAVRVPQDIALVAMEDGIGFDLLTTPVTRLRKPVSNMALKTANILWSEIKNQGKTKYKRQVSLAPELVVRSSCGSYLK